MEGEVNNSNNKGTDSFRDYLISSKDNMFALDLSGCTLIECINKMCKKVIEILKNRKKEGKSKVSSLFIFPCGEKVVYLQCKTKVDRSE